MLLFAEPLALVGIAIALVVGLTFHEFNHAFVAEQLGDPRPRAMGRVSLNPLRHIDPMGAIVFFMIGFGWARPVLVNPYALRPGRFGMAIVAAAGPIANVVVAIAFSVAFRLLDFGGVGNEIVLTVIYFVILFNIALAIFNLIPIPPLDGYNLVLPFLPPRQALLVQRYAHYGGVAILLLVALVYLGGPNPIGWIFSFARDAALALTGVG